MANSEFDLSMYSDGIRERCSFQLFRNLFTDCNWMRIASLHDILPLVSEIDPKRYLSELEQYIEEEEALICLFPKKNEDPLFTRNFIYGIIWSLETLAWDGRYMISCVQCLGMIARKVFSDEESLNLVTDAIKTKLLPWHPQTMASVQKQKNAVQTLQVQVPKIRWIVIKGLLPKDGMITIETPKPKYICKDIPPLDEITNDVVENLFRYYSSIAVELAAGDPCKLEELADNIDYMEEECIEIYLSGIVKASSQWSDEERFSLWNKLSDTKEHILLKQKDAGSPKTALYEKLCESIEALKPMNTSIAYRRLYLARWDDLYSEENFRDHWEKKEKRKKQAVFDIYENFGVETVQEFGVQVNDLRDVGYKLGQSISLEDMQDIFHIYADQRIRKAFLSSIMKGIIGRYGMNILLSLNLESYDKEFVSDMLSLFSLSDNLIELAEKLLPKQEECFWRKAKIPSALENDGTLDIKNATNRLIRIGRVTAAVNLCGNVYGELPVPDRELISMLKKAAGTESNEKLDVYPVQSLIQKLQEAHEPDIDELSEVELIYLPWMNETSQVHPRALICRLANDADFFCELLKLYYKRHHSSESEEKRPKLSEAWGERLFQIFHLFRAVPGTDWSGAFHEDDFIL